MIEGTLRRGRSVHIALMFVAPTLTLGLISAFFAILARTGGDFEVKLGRRSGTPAWFSLMVVGLLVVGMAVFSVVSIAMMRARSRETPREAGVEQGTAESSTGTEP